MSIDVKKFFAMIDSDPGSPEEIPHEAAPDGKRETGAGATGVAEPGTGASNLSPLGAKLEATAGKSLEKAHEILDIPLDPERIHYPAELRAQTALINTTLITQARVDETGLRQQPVDRLPEIIKLIQEEERRASRLHAAVRYPADLDADAERHLQEVVREMRLRYEGVEDG
jgi:hypothetical protein